MGLLHKKIFSFFNFLKKDENKFLFVVKKRTYLSGNLLAFLIFMLDKNKELIVFKHGKCAMQVKNFLIKQGVKVYENSFNLKDVATSKYVFVSHSPYDAYITDNKDRYIINLWHGVPFKKIGLLIPGITAKKREKIIKENALIDMVISSSDKDKEVMAEVFGIDEEKVKVTGLPRYEFLFKSYEITKDMEKRLKKIKQNKKLVLYAPTLREKINDPLEQIYEEEWRKIDSFAKANEIVFAVRSHYYEQHSFNEIVKKFDNIVLLNHKDFFETNTILKYTDLLISDFSSIWIDYLLLNRPIVGFAKDFEHFMKNERGFLYDFDSTFPGSFAKNVNEMLTYIKNDIGKKIEYPQKRLFHKYDKNFSNYVYNEVKKLKGK
ncbi:CDP-glycerol glycerophosphotransferase family protein [Caminibacter pacificus]|uniref:CDP-glycerol glycerophosphotransferase (TagB/SpsB family) n=1 Tax=Caminibacter pacificus TaxID=1424653 RepID=A0AAJ4UXG4_9BACT|nr:CDP-glycerol glycerophosphotransferase family protein [Caminibacter pacificus]QCI29079.1 hypothetical protein C6V80_08940 [Caminibacter pacificus]ROR39100.1 CDP-glycerol glycerophosphotransferase (TagB/SpsB family) [Caminibacter pacificus]